jgi:hypothetical protein
MNSNHDFGLNCLAQYEKIFKVTGTEEGPLAAAGGYFNSKFYHPDDATHTAFELKTNPWPLGWRGYLSDLNAPDRFPNLGSGTGTTDKYTGAGAVAQGLDNAQVGDIIYLTHQDVQANGLCDDGTTCSENSACSNGGTCTYAMPLMAIVTGVSHGTAGGATWSWTSCVNGPCTGGWCSDKSTCGDGGTGLCKDHTACSFQNAALADMSQCPAGANCVSTCSDYVTVVDENNGKYPDVCGNTDYRGMGQPRTIYKEFLPGNVYESLFQAGTTKTSSCHDSYSIQSGSSLTVNNGGSCMDPKMSTCTFGPTLWNQFEIYRPTQDVRTNSSR